MKITNYHNLPPSVYNALCDVYEPTPDRLWVTHLVGAPLQRQLLLKHWDELEEDASDRLWSLLGKAAHKVFEVKEDDTVWREKHIEVPVDGITVSGTLDYYNYNTGTLEDFKITSVYSFLLGDKPEWEAQLNVYAWMIIKYIQKENLVDICQPKQFYIRAILRDWQKSKTVDWDYPKIPFMSVAIPNWGFEKQDAYVRERIKLHLAPATECTQEEKWTRPSKWALMKEGRKSAVKVEDDEEAVNRIAAYKGFFTDGKLKSGYSIVERVGANVKCESYCICRSICPYV